MYTLARAELAAYTTLCVFVSFFQCDDGCEWPARF
jgi:hypothetical protein